MSTAIATSGTRLELSVPANGAILSGELVVPAGSKGVVIFAHGSGSSRHSPRNKYVASAIQEAGVATLLMDLLTPNEERFDAVTRQLRFDIPFLARRVAGAASFISNLPETRGRQIGLFGASTGAAAALVAAAEPGQNIGAVVSRGGRPDLAEDSLPKVRAATLLIVGGLDELVIDLNEQAYNRLQCEKEMRIVHGATHLFEEAGTLEEVARLAAGWFREHLHSVEPGD